MWEEVKEFFREVSGFYEQYDFLGVEDHIFLDVTDNGLLPFNTGQVKVGCFRDPGKEEEVPVVFYNWYRNIDGRNYLLSNRGNEYWYSFEDIGSHLVLVVSESEDFRKTKSIKFEPVTLDPACRVEIDENLKLESTRFAVHLPVNGRNNAAIASSSARTSYLESECTEIVLGPNELVLMMASQEIVIELRLLEIESLKQSHDVLKVIVDKSLQTKLPDLELLLDSEGSLYFLMRLSANFHKEVFGVMFKIYVMVRATGFREQMTHWESSGLSKGLFSSLNFCVPDESSRVFGELFLQVANLQKTLRQNVNFTKNLLIERDSLREYSRVLETDLKSTLKDTPTFLQKDSARNVVKAGPFLNTVDTARLGLDSAGKGKERERDLEAENARLVAENERLKKHVKAIKDKRRRNIERIDESLNHCKAVSDSQETAQQDSSFVSILSKDTDKNVYASVLEVNSKTQALELQRLDIANLNDLLEQKTQMIYKLEYEVRALQSLDLGKATQDSTEVRARLNELELASGLSAPEAGADTSKTELLLSALNIENQTLHERNRYLVYLMENKLTSEEYESLKRSNVQTNARFEELRAKVEKLALKSPPVNPESLPESTDHGALGDKREAVPVEQQDLSEDAKSGKENTDPKEEDLSKKKVEAKGETLEEVKTEIHEENVEDDI